MLFAAEGGEKHLCSQYADKFGFTKEETKKLLKHFRLGQNFDTIKSWYNGYKMGEIEDIYNPWSITGYIVKHREGFKAHWVNTGSDELIKERIVVQNAQTIRLDVEKLLLGQSIRKTIEEKMVFSDFLSKKELFWSLLLYSGYLTVHQKEEAPKIYQLKIPNYEIKTLFQNIVWDWFEMGMNVTPLSSVKNDKKPNRKPH